ncbi:replication protein A 70 kDa DNA-binding subunit B, partial [Tanacetum coccineum]
YINDLSVVKDNITLRLQILRAWMQPLYGKQHVKNLELIVLDEHNTKMQETVRMALVNQFKDRLKEGSAVTLEGYSLGEIQPKFRMVKKALRLSFLSSTKVEPCPDFVDLSMVLTLEDVIGHVTACEDLDMYDKNGKSGKKKPLTLVDHEGNELQCTLWSAFAQQFNDFLNTCADHEKIILGVTSVIVGTIIAIHVEEGWWYIGCRSCKKKVIRKKEIIDLEMDMPKKSVSGKDDWWCTKCNVVPTIKTMFRLQVRVQDETGTMSLTLWNDEVQAVVDRSAYQLCEKYSKGEQNDQLPTEITSLIGKKYAFKVSIDEYNVKKLLPMDTEATSSALPNITPLDLESQTDENTTPVSTHKNNIVDDVEQKMLRMGRINVLLKMTSAMSLQ